MKRENVLLVIIAAALSVVAIFWFFNNQQSQRELNGVILFYGDGCSHCKNVDDFINQNKIEEKIKFTKLEIPFQGKTSPELRTNANLLTQAAKKCNVDTGDSVSIPFLYNGNNSCLMGDVDVINFFKNAASIQS